MAARIGSVLIKTPLSCSLNIKLLCLFWDNSPARQILQLLLGVVFGKAPKRQLCALLLTHLSSFQGHHHSPLKPWSGLIFLGALCGTVPFADGGVVQAPLDHAAVSLQAVGSSAQHCRERAGLGFRTCRLVQKEGGNRTGSTFITTVSCGVCASG